MNPFHLHSSWPELSPVAPNFSSKEMAQCPGTENDVNMWHDWWGYLPLSLIKTFILDGTWHYEIRLIWVWNPRVSSFPENKLMGFQEELKDGTLIKLPCQCLALSVPSSVTSHLWLQNCEQWGCYDPTSSLCILNRSFFGGYIVGSAKFFRLIPSIHSFGLSLDLTFISINRNISDHRSVELEKLNIPSF